MKKKTSVETAGAEAMILFLVAVIVVVLYAYLTQ